MGLKYLTAEPFMMPDVIELLEEMGLDSEDLVPDEFVVATENDSIIACGRVLQHEDALELASIGVVESERGKGIGSEVVRQLLGLYPGEQIYTVTDIPLFFQRFGLSVVTDYPESIAGKLQRCKEELQCENPVVLSIKL